MSIIKLADAITRAFQNGALSNSSIKRLKQSGILRSPERMVAGMQAGTQNIANKLKVRILEPQTYKDQKLVKTYGNYITYRHPNGQEDIYHNYNNAFKYTNPISLIGRKGATNHALALRHEIDEMRESGKGNLASMLLKSGKPIGQHNNLSVIGEESNNVHILKNLYGAKESLSKLRHKTQEDTLFKRVTGKDYGKEHLNKKELLKMKNAPYDFKYTTDQYFGPIKLTGGYIANK